MEIIIDKIYFHVIDLWIKLYIQLKSIAVKENNSESNTGMLWHLFLILKKIFFTKSQRSRNCTGLIAVFRIEVLVKLHLDPNPDPDPIQETKNVSKNISQESSTHAVANLDNLRNNITHKLSLHFRNRFYFCIFYFLEPDLVPGGHPIMRIRIQNAGLIDCLYCICVSVG